MVRIKKGASAPAVQLSTAAKRQLLGVDLAGSDPALMEGGGKRLKVSTAVGGGAGSDGEEDGDGHVGGRGEFVLTVFCVFLCFLGGGEKVVLCICLF